VALDPNSVHGNVGWSVDNDLELTVPEDPPVLEDGARRLLAADDAVAPDSDGEGEEQIQVGEPGESGEIDEPEPEAEFIPSKHSRKLDIPVTMREVGEHTICVSVGQTGRRLQAIEIHCVVVTVPPCRVCVSATDTLQSLAREYDTDWLQIWGANPDIDNPDNIVEGTSLNLGPIYKVKNHDNLELLAEKFGTSVKNIKSVNFDIQADDDGQLAPGQQLCLMPSIYAASYVTKKYGAG
jgi:LysM repeat protein